MGNFPYEYSRGLCRIFLRSAIAINALFLLAVLRQCTVVHGDGPGGFGEVVIKGLLAQFSIIMFVFAAASAHAVSRCEKTAFLPFCAFMFSTLVLVAIFSFSIQDACSNNEGYCKQWRMDFSGKDRRRLSSRTPVASWNSRGFTLEGSVAAGQAG